MKTNISKHFVVLSVIFLVGFGCKLFPLNNARESKVETKTEITKDILRERLVAKDIKTASEVRSDKPNPLTLNLKFGTQNDNFTLNKEYVESFGELTNKLKEIFKSREENGVFIEGTNEIYKKITLSAHDKIIDEYKSKRIFVEDFEKLVDDLRKEGFDQIELDFKEEKLVKFPIERPEMPNLNKDSSSTKSKDIKTVSGGVLNGKATNLVKPDYPPAARAVRASGAVNVQVLIDENGDVISASAVSGHPLLRASAVKAAKDSTFSPTLLSGKPVKVSGVIVYNFKME